MSTIDGMSPCTNYTIVVGAGPYIFRQKSETDHPNHQSLDFDDQEEENQLLEIINKIWSSGQNALRLFAFTLPVSTTIYIN